MHLRATKYEFFTNIRKINVRIKTKEEKFYQKAIAQNFKIGKFNFKEQLPARIFYKGKFLGIYYFDFLVEDKIVLEIKVRNYFSKKDIDQLYSYLKAQKLKCWV